MKEEEIICNRWKVWKHVCVCVCVVWVCVWGGGQPTPPVSFGFMLTEKCVGSGGWGFLKPEKGGQSNLMGLGLPASCHRTGPLCRNRGFDNPLCRLQSATQKGIPQQTDGFELRHSFRQGLLWVHKGEGNSNGSWSPLT